MTAKIDFLERSKVATCKSCNRQFPFLKKRPMRCVLCRDLQWSTYNKIYYEKNTESLKIKARKYQEENRDTLIGKCKAYRENAPESIKLQRKNLQKAHRSTPEGRQKSREYEQGRKSCPLRRLRNSVRSRIAKALLATQPSDQKIRLVGCTISELRTHLERQFQLGMTWENRGRYGWHIDHIRPCASFDLTDPEQQKLCFHFTNLQPLWAEDNLAKGAKWDEVF